MTKPTGVGRGRPKGAKNRRTSEYEAATAQAAQAIEGVIPQAFQGDGHALLMTIYKDPSQPMDIRIEAAKASMPYEKPRLAAIEHSGGLDLTHHEAALDDLD